MPTARQRPCAFPKERERYIDRKTICFKCIRERRGQADVHCWYARRQPQIYLRSSHDRMHFLFTMSKILADASQRLQAVLPDKLSGEPHGPCELHGLLSMMRRWWSQTGSNRRPHACKARALPTELWPRRRTEDGYKTTEMNSVFLSSVVCRPSSEAGGPGKT